MANNCLKTQLKAEVNNDNLPVYGFIKAKVRSLANFELVVGYTEATTIYLQGATYNSSDEISITANTYTTIVGSDITATADKIYVLLPRYAYMTRLYLNSIDVNTEDLQYLSLYNGIVLGDIYANLSYNTGHGDIKYLIEGLKKEANASGKAFVFAESDSNHYKDIYGDVTPVGKDIKVKRFALYHQQGLTGCIDNLGYSMDVLADINLSSSKNITLTIENLVANAVHSGVTTHVDITLQNAQSCYTEFKGLEVGSGGQYKLKWEPSSGNTLITFNGDTTTIHVNSDGTWTRVS